MKEYRLNIDPRILELLGPSLYTNIYYVLAELIANAYDADAKNVYIIANRDDITVEDDGIGMSYERGDIAKYLNVGGISRSTDDEARTPVFKRFRMGRKGVGKLAALSVSETVLVKTKFGDELSGFVLSRHPHDTSLLDPIPEDQIVFERVTGNGSAIVMQHPQYRLHSVLDTIARNLLKIFPLIDSSFRIHICRGGQERVIDAFDKKVMKEMCALITLGKEFKDLIRRVPNTFPKRRKDLAKSTSVKTLPLILNDIHGAEHEYTLEIKGWIGAYKSTKGRKATMTDFPDNFISLYANGKMGEFNILPVVGQNKLNEVYVVGQLHVDLFELTELPDMALSNRQGYKSDDPRYAKVLEYVRSDLLAEILRMRDLFVDLNNVEKKRKKIEEQKAKEALLREQVKRYGPKVAATATKRIVIALGGAVSQTARNAIQAAIADSINENNPSIGLKSEVDGMKKRILISQTYGDKPLADTIHAMLIRNGVPAEDILYTNCDDEICRPPEGVSLYDYLRDFFVNSYSTQKLYVLFVTSENTKKSWGAITEVGAAWITQIDHKIFNIHPFRPEHPLDDSKVWQTTNRDGTDYWMLRLNADIFCQKIESVCKKLEYKHATRAENMVHLETLVSIRDTAP